MCGIVGAIAERNVVPILMEGLRRLEYRGYDSAGIFVIDSSGYIKNCPSMEQHYGHISYTSLISVANKSQFKLFWDISKDKIEVCKDCEFRHICTDCRAYTLSDKSIYAKPSKCSYDPYTASGF